MKNYYFITVLLFMTANLEAQKHKIIKELTPARGYYKDLQTYSPKPVSPGAEVDLQKFPYDAASAEKRLTLTPYYLKNVSLNDFKIPDPPANSSEQTRAELNYLLNLQKHRTNYEVESSLVMAGIAYSLRVKPEDSTWSQYRDNLFQIGHSVGSWFNPEDLPLTADLIANVWRDASYYIWGLKFKYLRVRPYTLEPDLNNLEQTDWAAYPSGHAANSYINAYIYQELYPEFSEVFLKDAYDMAHSREILGVHYPSDSEASRIFARQFVNKLFENDQFLKDFARVKNEWKEKAKETFIKPANNTPGLRKPAPGCGQKTASASPKKCQ
jgi:acid phosphatase (class A)